MVYLSRREGKKIASNIDNSELQDNDQDTSGDYFDFMLWKTDLNKELLSFWDMLSEEDY